ncbi:hypothetical protein BIV57_19900 [Mangrovactinospora gilvigrisea]|uniref:MerR family transcriptional regulator n=1 Tax=Mangrovactinospora gilvigrisea TaxID=1428644 RepID=A0A1J7BAM0_9ACTN|nr:MerR family transcriptional regulator [Mangrovactinospora gilvigrisea]OIV35743.1 hypothetical protein BIV57_19900 [Mangrovactinospora gilvigrisea]
MTIGEFARATGLSAKALRLYDDVGLLRPHRVDPGTGYRHYAEEQVARALLIARLRHLGMPLERIRSVLDRPAGHAAAGELTAFWAETEAALAERRRLAERLVDQLTGAGPAPGGPELTLRHASRCERGLVRPANHDAARADAQVLAVADGYGPDGGRAAAAAVRAPRGGDPAAVAAERVRAALHRIGAAGGAGSGTTLTALLRPAPTASALTVLHAGDSRAYLLRDGGLFRITRDDSHVQALVEAGRLTGPEAEQHPERPLLLRALDGRSAPRAVAEREIRAGDRYLLCTDGLCAVVAEPELRRTLADDRTAGDPDAAADALLALAHRAGAPDNIALVVADAAPSP